MSDSIVMLLLEKIGYEVEEDLPGSPGATPDQIFQRLAQGQSDLTLQAWIPLHLLWFEAGLPDDEERTLDDFVTLIEPSLQPAGGLQGFLITKSWAEAEDITHLGQINDDVALAAALDRDGDGLGEVHGCPESWTCDDIINAFIFYGEWSALEQLSDLPGAQAIDAADGETGFDAVFENFVDLVNRDEPAVAYVWTPTSYYADARVGEKTLWLSVTNEDALHGTYDLYEQGSSWPHRLNPDGSAGFTNLPGDLCTQGPDGCQTGFQGSDISAVANSAWLAENPDAKALVQAIEFDPVEMSELVVELEALDLDEWDDKVDASLRIAQEWIDENPDRVDSWLGATG